MTAAMTAAVTAAASLRQSRSADDVTVNEHHIFKFGNATTDDVTGFKAHGDVTGFKSIDDVTGFKSNDDVTGFKSHDDVTGFKSKRDVRVMQKFIETALVIDKAMVGSFKARQGSID